MPRLAAQAPRRPALSSPTCSMRPPRKPAAKTVAGAGHVDHLGRQRRHVEIHATADEARPCCPSCRRRVDAGAKTKSSDSGSDRPQSISSSARWRTDRRSGEGWEEALDALASIDLAGVEGDLRLGGQPLEQRELRLERRIADERREQGEAGPRRPPRHVAGENSSLAPAQTRLRRSPSSSSNT